MYPVHTIGEIGAADCASFPPDPSCFLGGGGSIPSGGSLPEIVIVGEPPAPFFGTPFVVGALAGLVAGAAAVFLFRR